MTNNDTRKPSIDEVNRQIESERKLAVALARARATLAERFASNLDTYHMKKLNVIITKVGDKGATPSPDTEGDHEA